MKKKEKIFFFDLDGTLLNSKKQINPQTKQALKEFTDKGNHFCISTGRSLLSAKDVYKSLDLNYKGSYLIGFNGSQIYDVDNKKTIYKIGVPKEIIMDIWNMADNMGIHIHTYNENYIISTKDDEETKFYQKQVNNPVKFVSKEEVLEQMSENEPAKLIAIDLNDHSKLEKLRIEIEKKYNDKLTVLFSTPYYLEIFNINSGKGNAVIKLCHILNIPIENSLAAGDQENDISMLKAAGTGIAMINGTEEVKKIADVITKKDNDNDGLVEFILKN